MRGLSELAHQNVEELQQDPLTVIKFKLLYLLCKDGPQEEHEEVSKFWQTVFPQAPEPPMADEYALTDEEKTILQRWKTEKPQGSYEITE